MSNFKIKKSDETDERENFSQFENENHISKPIAIFRFIDNLTKLAVFSGLLYLSYKHLKNPSICQSKTSNSLFSNWMKFFNNSSTYYPKFDYDQNRFYKQWRNIEHQYHEEELANLRKLSQWKYSARVKATKAQKDYIRRQLNKKPNYQSWRNKEYNEEEEEIYNFRNRQYQQDQHENYYRKRPRQRQQQYYYNENSSFNQQNDPQNSVSKSDCEILNAKIVLGLVEKSVLAKLSPSELRFLISKPLNENEIKTAFKQCALRDHPDMTTGSDEKFKQVAHAYNTLMKQIKMSNDR